MDATWTDLDRSAWEAGHARALGALQQDWAYGEAFARHGAHVARAVVRDGGRPVALAQFLWRRFGLFTGAVCLRGPVWLEPLDAGARAAAYALLKRTAPLGRPRAVLFAPDEAGPKPPGVQRMQRVMTGPSTVLIDLTRPLDALRADLDGKWRNRLVQAEKDAGLAVVQNGAKPGQYQWLLEREAAQRRTRGYKGLPERFVEAFQAAKPGRRDGLLILRADCAREPAAAMMFLRHGAAATYHVGWTGEEGRKRGAHALLLWKAIEALKAAGVARLDLGGVDTGPGAGLARFKLGAGGAVLTLAGTYY